MDTKYSSPKTQIPEARMKKFCYNSPYIKKFILNDAKNI